MDANDLLLTRDAYLIPKAQPRLLSCDVSAGQRGRGARGSWLLVALTGGLGPPTRPPGKGGGTQPPALGMQCHRPPLRGAMEMWPALPGALPGTCGLLLGPCLCHLNLWASVSSSVKKE